MKFKVSVVKEVIIELDEQYYDKNFLNDIRGYWQGLNGYDDEDVLEWMAEHIGESVSRGMSVSEIEGVHINKDAHKVINISGYTEIENIT